MNRQNFFPRFVFLSVLFASLFGSSLYAKPLTTDEKAKRKKEVVAMLSGTTWDVELFPMDDPKKKTIKDVVSYEHGRLKSKAFATEGYSESNLTVTIEDDGKAVWETMQSHATKGPIFWRGELAEKTVNGVLSRQNKDGTTDAYSLRGIQSGTFVVEPEKAPVIIQAPKEVVPPAAPAVPAVVAAPAAANALDALLGKKAPVAPAAAAVTPAAAKAVPAVLPATAVKPAISTPAVTSAVPAKPAATTVKTEVKTAAVAAVKTEVKPAVAATPASVEKKKEEKKKSKWSW